MNLEWHVAVGSPLLFPVSAKGKGEQLVVSPWTLERPGKDGNAGFLTTIALGHVHALLDFKIISKK